MAEQDYTSLIEAARADDRVLGLVLTGSRGREAFVRPDSDWDVRLVVRDDALAEAERLFATPRGAPVEAVVFPLMGFEKTGEIGSPDEWDRYSYTHAQVVLDKLDGRITELVAAKGVLQPVEARDIAGRMLDTYINSYYRSAKNLRSEQRIESHLDASEPVPPFLSALFAMHDRVRPFKRFLRWELEQHPLGEETWDAEALLPRLQTITATGARDEQRRLFRDTERLAREHGLGSVVDGWETDVVWLRGEAD
jgi:hypothetical protein